MHLILVSGVSGSGKSVAIRALEDFGFHCVDNLLVSFLPLVISHYVRLGFERIAISVDARGGKSIREFPKVLSEIKKIPNLTCSSMFLDARTTTLLRRYSETRRNHPLAHPSRDLRTCITLEREMLQPISDVSYRMDTTELSPRLLRLWIKEWIALRDPQYIHIILESFGYKHGVPRTADFVFDARCLPNPYYEPRLKTQTGRDEEVIAFFEHNETSKDMLIHIQSFISHWFPYFEQEGRNYLTIAIGCTGGQHRSVFLVEKLANFFRQQDKPVLTFHRQLPIEELSTDPEFP